MLCVPNVFSHFIVSHMSTLATCRAAKVHSYYTVTYSTFAMWYAPIVYSHNKVKYSFWPRPGGVLPWCTHRWLLYISPFKWCKLWWLTTGNNNNKKQDFMVFHIYGTILLWFWVQRWRIIMPDRNIRAQQASSTHQCEYGQNKDLCVCVCVCVATVMYFVLF